ncbi:hypothetical protein QFC24_006475 [Naganishia onofrii]|uniref:Uncharacterized protein n=1 Tax=Naganishia onofrii TaxID=1851511 RepID=A0ACC2X166_9TREE|nr:hypothetical protein QFC24_006475 [Naganishia onofrii]
MDNCEWKAKIEAKDIDLEKAKKFEIALTTDATILYTELVKRGISLPGTGGPVINVTQSRSSMTNSGSSEASSSKDNSHSSSEGHLTVPARSTGKPQKAAAPAKVLSARTTESADSNPVNAHSMNAYSANANSVQANVSSVSAALPVPTMEPSSFVSTKCAQGDA